MSLPAVFLPAIAIGVLVAAPVGAIGLLCIQRTLARGRFAGYATGAGVATADALYASIAAFGRATRTTCYALRTESSEERTRGRRRGRDRAVRAR